MKTISNAVIFLKTLFMAVRRHRGPHRFFPLLTWSAEHHDCLFWTASDSSTTEQMSKSKTWLLITLTSSRFQLPAVHITPQLHLCRPGLMLTPLLNGCRAQTHCSTLPPLALLPTLSQTLTHHFHFRFAVAPNLLLALKKHAVSREPAPTGVLTPPTPPD